MLRKNKRFQILKTKLAPARKHQNLRLKKTRSLLKMSKISQKLPSQIQ